MPIEFVIILLPFLVASLIPIFHRFLSKNVIGWVVFIIPLSLFIILTTFIPRISNGETFSNTYEWIPSFNINFTTYLDGLSLIFSLLITGIGTLVVFYSNFYLSKKESLRHFYCYLLLFMGAMLGVVFSDNLMVLYAFWELTSVSSFLLIAFWHHRKASRAGARKSMTITVSGGIAMLAGFLMLYTMSGTLSIREIIGNLGAISEHDLFIPALVLVLLGAFTKSAQFPFHIWLPDAMEAPTPVSAYLHSATMVKAGIYVVARFTPIFGGESTWFWLITGVGLITLFWGSFNAVKQTDLKAILAFSTVSQLGLIMSLLGIGSVALYFGYSTESVLYTQATFAALFHLINHSTFKGALFMMVGIVDHEVGTRDIRRLGGLMSFMPVTFTIALIGSFSMAGLPPFNGFLSKEMFFTAAINISNLDIFSLDSLGVFIPIIAWIASIFTFVYCLIVVGRTFTGKVKPDIKERGLHEAPFGMLVSPLILVALVILIFFFPNVIGNYLIKPAITSVYPTFPVDEMTPRIYAWHGFNLELWMTIGVVILGIVLYKLMKYWTRVYKWIPQRLTLNSMYEGFITTGENLSGNITKRYMNGNLTSYFVYIYVFFVAIVAVYFIGSGALDWDLSKGAKAEHYELILVFVMMFASISLIFAKSRISTVFINGVLGYSVGFFFITFRAPDLALTQLVVESVTTALFLICFKFLPKIKKETGTRTWKVSKGVISIFVGATVTIVGLAVVNYDKFATISTYFDDAYNLAGGKNIVNTILGDFRAFDTMLEVVVLFIAGLGIYSLIKLKAREGDTKVEKSE
ncbi:Multisubunit sodium/proton antiporter MrpA subunit OS=Ureibacillus acetophenoni OX=614649 GN=SAMN05877842_112102 PE=3 SV=1 [Ureibacillus acetophenoni]